MTADELTAFRLKLRHELEAADELLAVVVGDVFSRQAEAHLSELCITTAALLHELRKENRR
jgi:hypothetical protein